MDNPVPEHEWIRKTILRFNNLPRPEIVPGRPLPNHWVFGVCHFTAPGYSSQFPDADTLLATNFAGQALTSMSNPETPLRLSTSRLTAEATVPALLQTLSKKSVNNPAPLAPWTWSTTDPALATALEDELKRRGVKPELCKVGVCNAEELDLLE
ncbi:hypothetical protein QBC39DRAFT_316463, partial [Podospora conica]